MKKIFVLAKCFIFMAVFYGVGVWVYADTIKIDYGYGVGDPARTGYELDSTILLDYHGGTVDTLDTMRLAVTAIDTQIVISGTGYHRIVLWGVYNGYPNEWYEVKVWEVPFTTSADLTGGGAYNATVYAIDTSGTDDSVSGILVTAKDATGTVKGYIATNSAGYALFHVDSGQWTFLAPVDGGYVWNDTVCTLVAANTTFDMYGYDLAVGAPAGDSLCRVYGYVYDAQSNALEGVTITYVINKSPIWDICNDQIIGGIRGDTITDVNGYFAFDLLYSKCLQKSSSGTAANGIPYTFDVIYPEGSGVVDKPFTVPAQDSAQFNW